MTDIPLVAIENRIQWVQVAVAPSKFTRQVGPLSDWRFYVMLLVSLLAPLPAQTQDKPEPEGQVCLPLLAHQNIIVDLRELKPCRKRVRLLEDKLQLQVEQIADLALAQGLAVQAQETATTALTAAVRGKREAEESRDAWHRSRALWLTVGFVAGIAMAIVAAKIVKDTQR